MIFSGKFKIFYLFLLLTISVNAQRVYSPSVPVSWTEQEKINEIQDGFALQRIFPYGNIDHDAYHNAVRSLLNENKASKRQSNTIAWLEAGSINIGGRLSDVEMDPNSFNTIYACAASGGIFKSTDAGNNWNQIFDGTNSQSIGDLAISPSDPNVLYAGTGESNAGGGSLTYDGYGVYKSNDAGQSWTHTGLELTRNTGRIAIHPLNSDVAFAATMGDLFENNVERGLYKTLNGGVSWQQVLYLNDSTGVVDVIFHPQNPDTVYACSWTRVRRIDRRNYGGVGSGLWRSYDGGSSWTQLQTGLPTFGMGRTSIGISNSNPDILYFLTSDSLSSFQGVYKSIDGGDSWNRTNDTSAGDIFNGSAHWEGRLKIDPTNSDVVYLAGFDTWQTLNGGQNWNNISNSYHPDNHEIFVHPLDPDYLLLANDGGLFFSHDKGLSWNHYDNLPLTQFYTCEIDERFPYSIAGGTQDNGTIITNTGDLNDWYSIWGGDGFYVLIDPIDGTTYAESQYGNISTGKLGVDPSDRFNWNTPFIFNPQNSSTLFLGANKLYKSEDRGAFWYEISPDLTNHNLSGYPITWGTITTISCSAVDSAIIYCGTDDGQLWLTKDNGSSWTNINPMIAERWITRVTTHPHLASTVFVTVSGYRFHDNMAHVYMSNDFGNTWQAIDGNLPDIPCNDIIPDPIRASTLYLATDIGVYVTHDLGLSWSILGTDLPLVPVTDLRLHEGSRILLAATYGRSMYTMDLLQLYTGIENLPAIRNLIAYPNPTSNELNIGFISTISGEGKLILRNIFGQKICLIPMKINQGMNSYSNINFKSEYNLAAGVYIIEIRSANGSTSEKVIIR